MSKILLVCVVISSVLFADELMMKDVNKLLYEAQNKILIIDKKDLNGFIVENNKKAEAEAGLKAKERLVSKVPTEVFLNLGEPVIINDVPAIAATNTPIVEKKVEKLIEKKVFSINNFEKYKEFIALQNKSEYNVSYTLKLYDLLKITQYLFNKNINEEYYPGIKSLLSGEIANNKSIEKKAFIEALDNMNYDIATEMLNEFSSVE